MSSNIGAQGSLEELAVAFFGGVSSSASSHARERAPGAAHSGNEACTVYAILRVRLAGFHRGIIV
jgi:hypothetical protein